MTDITQDQGDLPLDASATGNVVELFAHQAKSVAASTPAVYGSGKPGADEVIKRAAEVAASMGDVVILYDLKDGSGFGFVSNTDEVASMLLLLESAKFEMMHAVFSD